MNRRAIKVTNAVAIIATERPFTTSAKPPDLLPLIEFINYYTKRLGVNFRVVTGGQGTLLAGNKRSDPTLSHKVDRKGVNYQSSRGASFISLLSSLLSNETPSLSVLFTSILSIVLEKEMSNQVFVRNLSYNCTEEELTRVFEGCGPLKRVSLAKEADGRNKGFGFVKFSLPEDAANAVQELQGREMGGRPLKLELAVKKGTNAANAKKEEIEALKATKQSQPTVEASSSHSTVKSRESDGKKRKLEDEGEKKTEVHSKDRKKKTDTTALAAANSIKTSRQVLIFGCPDSLRASVIQAVIAAKDIKRFKVKLIQKVITSQTVRY